MACSAKNLARQGTATQVDIYRHSLLDGTVVELEASRAIDGDKDGTYEYVHR